MPTYENVTEFDSYLVAINTITGGWFLPSVMVVFFLVLFLSNLRFGRAKALTVSSFTVGLILLVFNVEGLINYWVITADLILFAIGVFMLLLEKYRFGD